MGFNKGIIIGVLLVALVFSALAGILLSVGTNYGVTVDPEFQETFDQYSESVALISDMEETITGGEVNPEGQDQAVYKQVIIAGKTSRQSANLAQDLLQETPKVIPVDNSVIYIIIAVIFTLTTFGFIAMISRRNP